MGPTLWASKVAILALYLRLFDRKKWLRYSSYAALTALTLVYWSSPIIAGVFCAPRAEEAWDGEVVVNCLHAKTAGPVNGGVGLAADLFLLALPLPIIWNLKLPTGRRIALASVFMMGVL